MVIGGRPGDLPPGTGRAGKDAQKAKIDWVEELIRYQNFTTITNEIADRFIDRVIVKNAQEITVIFWFGDIFEEELFEEEGGLSYAI